MITTHETVHSRGVPSLGPSLCLLFLSIFSFGVNRLAFFDFFSFDFSDSRTVLLLLYLFSRFFFFAVFLRWSNVYSNARRGGVFLLQYSFLALFFVGSLGFSFTIAFLRCFPLQFGEQVGSVTAAVVVTTPLQKKKPSPLKLLYLLHGGFYVLTIRASMLSSPS